MFGRDIVAWYRANRRELPWRGDEACFHANDCTPIPVSAYGIWVSEVMSQQTRIDTVIPYWLRWMKKYPTVKDLAEASAEEVNTLWAGLGYYRRCRFLLDGAKVVVEKHGGEVPGTVKELLTIPGIGPYTAGAIASIAHGVVVPAVDGNVLRVMSRVCTLEESINANAAGLEKVVYSRTLELMHEAIPTEAAVVPSDANARIPPSAAPCTPSEFNQAMMELGALVCTPATPACEKTGSGPPCPVQAYCRARAKSAAVKKLALGQEGSCADDSAVAPTDGDSIASVTIFPMKALKIKKSPPEFTFVVGVVRATRAGAQLQGAAAHEYLFAQRPASGLLAGQWEFPNVLYAATGDGADGDVPGAKKVKGAAPAAAAGVVVSDAASGAGALGASAAVGLLLAGLAERYGLEFSVGSVKSERAKTKVKVEKVALPQRLCCAAGPQVLPGVITHVFSHQVHKMQVVLLDVAHEDVAGGVAQWMSRDELVNTRGCTTGCKKVLAAVAKHAPEKK